MKTAITKAQLVEKAWREFHLRIDAIDPAIVDQVLLYDQALKLQPYQYQERERLMFEIGFQYALLCFEEGRMGPVL